MILESELVHSFEMDKEIFLQSEDSTEGEQQTAFQACELNMCFLCWTMMTAPDS